MQDLEKNETALPQTITLSLASDRIAAGPAVAQAVAASGEHRWPSRRFLAPGWEDNQERSIRSEMGWMHPVAADPTFGQTEVQLPEDSEQGLVKVTLGETIVWRSRISAVNARALLEVCAVRHSRDRSVHAPLGSGGENQLGVWRIDRHEVGGEVLHIARLEGPEPSRLPDFLGAEVTSDPRYRASWIASYGLPLSGHALWTVTLPDGQLLRAELPADPDEALALAQLRFGKLG